MMQKNDDDLDYPTNEDTDEVDDEDFDFERDKLNSAARNKKKWILLLGCLCIIIIVIITVVSPLQAVIFHPFAGSAIPPTPTLVPGDNLFYIEETLPGTVTVDGHPFSHFLDPNVQPPIDPKLKQYVPLRLSKGVHHMIWQAAPFKPLSCLVFVPSLASSQTCSFESAISLTNGLNAWLVAFTPTLSDVSIQEREILEQDMQQELNTLQSSDTVYPGEQYLGVNATGSTLPITATQTLKAILRFHLDVDPSSPRSCVDGYGDICTFNNGQSCLQLCILDYIGSTWDVAALYYPTWTYMTEYGQVVAQNQPDTIAPSVGTDHSAIFQVSWDGQGWQVTDISALSQTGQQLSFLQSTGAALTANPACASLSGLINSTTTYASTNGTEKLNVSWSYYVGNDLSSGCLGVVQPTDSTGISSSYCLYRFGILLAANEQAHRFFPALPLADAYEQSIAQAIAAKNKR